MRDKDHGVKDPKLTKMIAQLIISVSVLFLLFCYSSLCSQKLNYFSSHSFNLLSGAVDKNCMFLICNGLLVFLATTSGLVPDSSPPIWGFDPEEMLQKRIGGGLEMAGSETLFEKDVIPEESDEEEEEERECSSARAPTEISVFIAESDKEGGDYEAKEVEDHDSARRNFDIDEEEEQGVNGQELNGEDETEMLKAEELNRKFEDFIRRMKEEIRINEARQQQLVMVN